MKSVAPTRVHTDRHGRIWSAAGGARRLFDSIEGFLGCAEFRYARRVQALGSSANAKLIVAMHAFRESKVIQIGSPAICLTKVERGDPEMVLDLMKDLDGCASSIGGFHQLTSYDFTIYNLVSNMQDGGWRPNDTARRLVKYHPAWLAFSFLPTCNQDKACQLMARIIDPRWFINAGRPNRLQRLYNYLGLNKTNFDRQLHPEKRAGHNYDYGMLTLSAWSGRWCAGPHEQIYDPANFLCRIVDQHDYEPHGYYLATRRFIQFLRAVWLDAIAPPGRCLFVPDHFFTETAEKRAFATHCNRFKGLQKKPV